MTPPKRHTTGPITPSTPRAAHERHAPDASVSDPHRPWWTRFAWPVAIIGITVFAVGWVGAQTGAIAIPGDRHHVLSQGIGLMLVVLGISLGSSRRKNH